MLNIYQSSILCVFVLLPGLSIADDHRLWRGYVGVRTELSEPNSSFQAYRKDSSVRWFNESSSNSSSGAIDFAIEKLNSYGISYRYRELNGAHRGFAGSYRCIVSLCSYVSGSLISDFETTDQVSYSLQMNRFLFYPVQESSLVKPTLGFDLIKAGIDVRGSGKSSEWTGLVALPVFGISTTFPINVGLSIETALVGTKINSGSKAILLSDFELKINHRIDKHHQLSLGYVKSRVLIQGTYSDFFSQIRLNQSSPSFQYRYWF